MKKDLIYCGIIFVLLLVVFGRREKKCPTITPNESTIIVVGDTASANVWKREVEVLRLENDSLKKVKAKVRIKYDTIRIQSAPMPVVDSVIRWNW